MKDLDKAAEAWCNKNAERLTGKVWLALEAFKAGAQHSEQQDRWIHIATKDDLPKSTGLYICEVLYVNGEKRYAILKFLTKKQEFIGKPIFDTVISYKQLTPPTDK